MLKSKISFNISIILVLSIIIFFLKNPLVNWLEGDFENIYFIYNTLLTANSITPDVMDYPGNSSFSINSLYLKIYIHKLYLLKNIIKIIYEHHEICNYDNLNINVQICFC